MEGGIVWYGEKYGDDGLWDGLLYVFDGCGLVDFFDYVCVIGECVGCGVLMKWIVNCFDLFCCM